MAALQDPQALAHPHSWPASIWQATSWHPPPSGTSLIICLPQSPEPRTKHKQKEIFPLLPKTHLPRFSSLFTRLLTLKCSPSSFSSPNRLNWSDKLSIDTGVLPHRFMGAISQQGQPGIHIHTHTLLLTTGKAQVLSCMLHP